MMRILDPESTSHRHTLDYVGYLIQRSGKIPFINGLDSFVLGCARRLFFEEMYCSKEHQKLLDNRLGKKVSSGNSSLLVNLSAPLAKGEFKEIILGDLDPYRIRERSMRSYFHNNMRILKKQGFQVVEQRVINPLHFRWLRSKERLSSHKGIGYYRVVYLKK